MSDPAESQLPPPDTRKRRTLVFAAVMVAVLGVFIGLSTIEGPPRMPVNAIHQDLKADTQCLSCHTWPQFLAPGQTVVKPLGPNHPPPREKKKRPGMDAGPEAADVKQFECLKCHAPR